MHDDTALLAAKLNQETARLEWASLQRFFARGQTIRVAPQLDLLAVATAFATDQREQVATWMDTGEVAPVSDQEAAAWHASDAALWTVVVAPWVLVQQPSPEPACH